MVAEYYELPGIFDHRKAATTHLIKELPTSDVSFDIAHLPADNRPFARGFRGKKFGEELLFGEGRLCGHGRSICDSQLTPG